jgi:methionyl-tRNA synthetase
MVKKGREEEGLPSFVLMADEIPEYEWEEEGLVYNQTFVRLTPPLRVLECNAGNFSLCRGDKVIIETDKGIELGTVVMSSRRIIRVPKDLPLVLRRAEESDIRQEVRNRAREREAFNICQEKIFALNLPIKLLWVEYLHGGNKAIFYFSSAERIDFRKIVKELKEKLHIRVEMKQVGARDESKIIGGIGPCGERICCSRFLNEFESITLQMAKVQNLPLLPQKISGLCGKLICCLAYEEELYRSLRANLPDINARVQTSSGRGKVVSIDILRGIAKVELESGQRKDFYSKEIQIEESTMENVYITTPIYYVNDLPHLGTAYSTVAADILARYYRARGRDVWFLTGLDEHGQKIADAAKERGVSPKEFTDMMAKPFRETWGLLNISFNDFIRTTEERHIKVAQKVWKELEANEDIYLGYYEGWYCVYEETHYLESQLVDGKCPLCNRKVEQIKEENYFFRLTRYKKKLEELYEKRPWFVRPEVRMNEVRSFVKAGLKDLSISRTGVQWGIPVPGASSHVMYVWFEALINYISALGAFSEKEEKFIKYWPASVHFIGKDILRFHAVYWPAFLMALKLEVPKQIYAHGFLTINGQKMSKSLRNVITPSFLVSEFGVDAVRYFLFREIPFGEDGDFSIAAFIDKINSDLVNDFGNLLRRTLVLLDKNFSAKIPEPDKNEDEEKNLIDTAQEVLLNVERFIEDISFSKALESIAVLWRATNKYLDLTAPWKLIKQKRFSKAGTVLYNTLEALRWVSLLIWPFMPQKANEVRSQIGLDLLSNTNPQWPKTWGELKPGQRVQKRPILFPRIDTTKNEIILKKFLK